MQNRQNWKMELKTQNSDTEPDDNKSAISCDTWRQETLWHVTKTLIFRLTQC